jgi:D-3-phosphoglycerate dehydrogenase
MSSAAPKILIADDLSPAAVAVFAKAGLQADVKTKLPVEELMAILPAYEGLAVRSSTKVTAQVLAATTNLRVIGRAGIGVDNIDVKAASASGVVVMNTPFGNSVTTAEHAFALLMALARQLPAADASTRAGKWEKSRFMGVELLDKLLGVIGCGNIGAHVAVRAKAFGMRVLAYDPYLTNERAAHLGVEKVELDGLLANADFITLHTPMTESTHHLLNATTLAKTKRGVRLINCARGGLIDEQALQDALASGQVAGAALDVFETEPAREHPLFADERVIFTPHLGASTAEAQEKVAVQVAEQMVDFLLHGAVSNAVNLPSVKADELEHLSPYLKLAEQLGQLAGQITGKAIQAVELAYEGAAAQLNTKALSNLAICGLLSPILNDVNQVNAAQLAAARGIKLQEVKRERNPDFQSLIRLTVTTESGNTTFAGTILGGKLPRIVELDGVHIEAELGAQMLYMRNADRPGFIGALGQCLGQHGINIATFHLGRTGPQQTAITLLQTDQPVPADVVKSLQQLPHVERVVTLSLSAA